MEQIYDRNKKTDLQHSNRSIQKALALANKRRFRENIPLYIMLALPLTFFIIFHYLPMFWMVIAFKDYNLSDGILGSPWVGFRNFEMIFGQIQTLSVIKNTFVLSLLAVFVGFPFPIILAIMLNEVSRNWYKKYVQTLVYLPHFFSWVIVGGIIVTIFSTTHGPINFIIKAMGGEAIPFLLQPSSWIAIFIGSGIWKEAGFSAIIYLAALTNIDPTLYEAAVIDGAGKWKQIVFVTIPCLMPTIVLMFILATGRIMEMGFERVYVFSNPVVRNVSEVVSTYIYDYGVRAGEFSLTTAMGLFDSLVGLVLVLITNKIAKKSGQALF